MVATLWLDRPGARNAMGPDFWTDLPRALGALSADPGVRAVVLAARGTDFSVGLDLKAMSAVLGDSAGSPASSASSAATTRRAIVEMQAAISSVANCPKPVVAAVHGWCIGGGMDLVTACDVRLAAADAVFSVRETRMAMVADLGSLQRLPRIVGSGNAAELALTGRDVDAHRAKEIGLVNDVLRDHDAVVQAAASLAAGIASLSPLAVQGTKAVLAASEGKTVAEGLDYVATWNAGMLSSADLGEAVTAFLEKRPPHFTGR